MKYTLTCKVINDIQGWNNVEVYLTNKKAGCKQLLRTVTRFEDTTVKILWVGDLDCDGSPDFIVDTSDKYEYLGAELFLSSAAEEGELVHLVARGGYSTEC